MNKLNDRQLNILEEMSIGGSFSSSQVFQFLEKKQKVSLVTVKRDLDYLTSSSYLERQGKGRSTAYQKTIFGTLFSPIDVSKYNAIDPDLRNGNIGFNFLLFEKFPLNIFSDKEKEKLDLVTSKYQRNIKNITQTIRQKELERFVIELSWKSSKIEGNTYSLLDTERLLREGVPAEGHPKNEAVMILNHKKTFLFILDSLENIKKDGIDLKFIEKIHEILIEGLGVSKGIRLGLVGITGAKYKPLDNKYQIQEALSALLETINRMENIYSKALCILIGISYIQPFEDGNKRVARFLCNAVLLSKDCAPLSYRSVDENYYKESILVFYEKNSLVSIKDIFIEQYLFSTDNYLVKTTGSKEKGSLGS